MASHAAPLQFECHRERENAAGERSDERRSFIRGPFREVPKNVVEAKGTRAPFIPCSRTTESLVNFRAVALKSNVQTDGADASARFADPPHTPLCLPPEPPELPGRKTWGHHLASGAYTRTKFSDALSRFCASVLNGTAEE